MEDKVSFREGKSNLRQVMLRTTKPLLAILLLLPLSVGAGELDGRAIYCKWLGSDSEAPFYFAPASDDVGFEFKVGRCERTCLSGCQ